MNHLTILEGRYMINKIIHYLSIGFRFHDSAALVFLSANSTVFMQINQPTHLKE